MKFLNFFKYNNVVPISISFLLLSAGGAFAAANPDTVLSQQQKTLTVDNTYIANKDLTSYTPQVRITGVTEDAASYSVAYSISTIDIDDYVWKDVVKSENMTVQKSELNGKDLGVYVTNQFKNIISNQIAFLNQVQQKERKQISQQTVATTYGGLVGRFLDSRTETLPGYVPVVAQTPATDVIGIAGQSASVGSILSPVDPGNVASNNPPATTGGNNPASGATAAGSSGTSQYLSLQVLGNNPAQIPLNSGYVDLGVVLIDPGNPNLGYYTFVDGKETSSISLDTSKSAAYTIEYRATDQSGVTVVARRVVLVGDATDPGGEVSFAGAVHPTVPPTVVVQPVAPAPTDIKSQPVTDPQPEPSTGSSTEPVPESEAGN